MHDDLFDFFYEALPGYDKVGLRRTLLGCWGSFQDPEVCNFAYKDMEKWGNAMFVTPGVVVDGKLHTHSLVDINLGIRILLGHSYYDDWTDQEMFVKTDPLGNPVDRRHPWNQHTNPRPQKRDFDDKYSWVMSPRWFDGKDHLALDTGGGPLARLWSTALAGLVDIGYVKSTGHSVQINLPKTALKGPVSFEWKIPQYGSNTIERNRARTYFQAYAAACALHFAEKALGGDPGRPHQDMGEVRRARRGHRLRVHRGGARCAEPPHGDPRRQDRELPPVSRRRRGTPTRATATARRDRTRTRCRASRSSRRTTGRTSRASTSCARCAVSTRACPAVSTCIWARGRRWRDCTPQPNPSPGNDVWPIASTRMKPEQDAQWRTAGDRIQTLLDASAAGGAVARERAEQLVREVTDLYGAGLERMMRWRSAPIPSLADDLRRRRPGRQPAAGARPAPARRRAPGRPTRWTACGPTSGRTAAMSTCSRSPDDGVVRLQFSGSCKSCPSSSVTLELAVEDAIRAAAPEIASIEVVAAETEPTPAVIPADSC